MTFKDPAFMNAAERQQYADEINESCKRDIALGLWGKPPIAEEHQIHPANIREVWDEVKPGLEATKQKISAPWRVEDVYSACLVGQAFLYLGAPGFVIVQPQENRLSGEPELLVWVAFSREQHSVERFQAAVDHVAVTGGFKTLVMWSNRPGWDKVPGWSKVATVYQRRLD